MPAGARRRGELAQLDDLLDLDDADLAGHRHGRVEVARRQAEAQVAAGVGHAALTSDTSGTSERSIT
jgi:hypothetical protein